MSERWGDFERNWITPAWDAFDRLLGVAASHRRTLAIVLALLAIDLIWIAYYALATSQFELGLGVSLHERTWLLITAEGGVPEWFNYAKALVVVLLMIRLARATREPIYRSLSFLFLIVVLDDGLGIHETAGNGLVQLLGIPRRLFGLRDHDIGEVITWGILGAIAVPLVLVTLTRSRPRHRANGLAMLLAFGGLLICAVFVDQLYASFHDQFTLAGVLIDIAEDGGEMLALTLAVALALGASREREQQQPAASAWQIVAARPRLLLAALVLSTFLLGLTFAILLHLPPLFFDGMYHADTLQSPHWSAYHSSTFRDDDLILQYASFNESPLQNGIYWVGTLFAEHVALSKYLSILSYGALAVFSFLIGRAMFGMRFGLLLTLFLTLFPDLWAYSSGFFSKFWAVPLLLVCVFLLQTERWRGLIVLLPFGAVAYPTVAVSIGMIVSVYWMREFFRDRERASRLFRSLAIGSIIAVAILSVKYVALPEGVGSMRSGAELHQMEELLNTGFPSHYIPIPPLVDALNHHVRNTFVVLNAALFFLILGRRVAWERSWTAVFVAAAVGYVLADVFFMRLYIPNRYTRYSLAVLFALWNARNWDLIMARLRTGGARWMLGLLIAIVGIGFYADSLEDQRDWSDRREIGQAAWFINAALPDDVLIAGSPKWLDDVMIQGKRSVLCPYRLAHPWYTDYYDEMRERIRATLRAHFAADPRAINELHLRYGVTHFLVDKELFERAIEDGKLFADPYNDEIYDELGERREFFLESPDPQLVLWEDASFAILRLPIPDGYAPRDSIPADTEPVSE